MASPLLKQCAACGFALMTAVSAASATAAPFMIVGNDEKSVLDAQGNAVINPSGKDTVQIVDLAQPEAPKIVATLPLENSIIGPPTNVAISPNGTIALVADAVTVAEENGVRKTVPTNKVFVIDLAANPPALAQTVIVGKQPSGLSFSPKGNVALVCNRGDGTISILKIDGKNVTQTGTVMVKPGVSHVVFTPDGKRALALKSPDNGIAVLDVSGDKVSYTKVDLPTYLFPYNIVVSPDSKLAFTADNGGNGSSDGNMDAISVIDLEGAHPHVIAHLTVEDAPEGLAISPDGTLLAVTNVNGSNKKGSWFYHRNGSVSIFRIQGKTVIPVKTVHVGTFPEATAFTPDGRYIFVGNNADQDFSILKVNGTDVSDTGKRFKVGGHPASARMGP